MNSFWKFLKAAFHAKGFLPFPPHWLLPFVWLVIAIKLPYVAAIGALAEALFLMATVLSPRFQNIINGQEIMARRKKREEEIVKTIQQLPKFFQEKYYELKKRCRLVVEDQVRDNPAEQQNVEHIVNNLLFVYYRLVRGWAELDKMVKNTDFSTLKSMRGKITFLEKQIADQSISPELARSYGAQIEILQTRLKNAEGVDVQLKYVEAECNRIEMQVELIKEQAAMSSDPTVVSAQVNAIFAGLKETASWINSQQGALGSIADDCMETPSLLTA